MSKVVKPRQELSEGIWVPDVHERTKSNHEKDQIAREAETAR